jgi:aminopeptidase N
VKLNPLATVGKVLGRRAGIAAVTVCVALSACSNAPVPPKSPRNGQLPLPAAAPGPTAPSSTDGWSQPTADPVYPQRGDANIDVGAYRLVMNWAPDDRILTGSAELSIRAARATNEARLDLAGDLTVDQVTVDGRPATATEQGDKLIVATGRSLAVGDRFTVTVRYHGTPQPASFPGTRTDVDGVGAHVGTDGAIWALSEPYGAYTWFPGSDQPSDKALLDVDLTVPAGWAGVSSGRLTGETTGPAGTRTFHWHQAEPIATYLVAFAVDRFDRIDETGPRGLPVTYWVRPADRSAMEPLLRRVPDALAWLSARLGPYPFSTAGVVIVPDASGLETQSMVTLGPIHGKDAVPVLVHELSHQWFGDTVTPRTWRDMWLNEGFATYVQMLYTVDKLGGDRTDTVRGWRAADAEWRRRAGPPAHYDPTEFAARNVYNGPALMLDRIRARIGDARFAALLRDWPQQHRNSNQDRAGFTAWLNGYAGQDLTALVDAWLDGATTPSGTD